MKTDKEQAKEYVRNAPGMEHLKELSVGCWLERIDKGGQYMVITDTGFGRKENAVWVATCVHGSMGIHWKGTEEEKKSVLEDTQGEHWKIIGHEPTGFDYLKVLGSMKTEMETVIYTRADTHIQYAFLPLLNDDFTERGTYQYITFNLTGEPLDEENAKKFMELVGK